MTLRCIYYLLGGWQLIFIHICSLSPRYIFKAHISMSLKWHWFVIFDRCKSDVVVVVVRGARCCFYSGTAGCNEAPHLSHSPWGIRTNDLATPASSLTQAPQGCNWECQPALFGFLVCESVGFAIVTSSSPAVRQLGRSSLWRERCRRDFAAPQRWSVCSYHRGRCPPAASRIYASKQLARGGTAVGSPFSGKHSWDDQLC